MVKNAAEMQRMRIHPAHQSFSWFIHAEKRKVISMKIRAAIALVLVLTLLSGGAAFAEASSSAPAAKTEENGSMSWIEGGISWIQKAYSTGKDVAMYGKEWLKQAVPVWTETVQNFIDEKSSDPEVQKAWNTIKEGAENAGKVSSETLNEAYHTVREWMQNAGETIDQEVASALDQMASAAGVEEAQVAEWYRTVENFVVSNAGKISKEAQKAWETIKEAQLGDGKTPEETVNEAYDTIREWMESFDNKAADSAEEALDNIMAETEQQG